MAKCLFGRADQSPGEGKWTFLLSSFRKTILRKLVHSTGILSRRKVPNGRKRQRPPDQQPGVDEEADEEALKAMRMERTCAYLAQPLTFHEIGVHCIVQGLCDTLFFRLMGGSDRSKPTCKVDELLAKRDSPITSTMRALYELLRDGSNDPDHGQWGLLHLLDAPMAQQGFQKWMVGQTLRMHSAIWRRYSVKFAGWPYRLNRLYSDGWTDQQRLQVATELRTLPDHCLDCFARGLRVLFPTLQAVQSVRAGKCVQSAFASMRVVTDFAERIGDHKQGNQFHRFTA